MLEVSNAPARRDSRDSEAATRIIAAVEKLLETRSLESITVAQVMREAGVARGTFYLWFRTKYEVVVEAHRRVMSGIVREAAPFLKGEDSGPDEMRAALEMFVETWRSHGPVLAASAEIWRSQPALRNEWQATMQTLIDGVAKQLKRGGRVADPETTAHALIWMNERTAYMAAAGLAPVELGPGLVDALEGIWSAVLR